MPADRIEEFEGLLVVGVRRYDVEEGHVDCHRTHERGQIPNRGYRM